MLFDPSPTPRIATPNRRFRRFSTFDVHTPLVIRGNVGNDLAMTSDYPNDSPKTTPIGLSIRDAATHYEISENAVRKRIQRGTIEAKKINNRWVVYVHDHPIIETPTTPETTPKATTDHPTNLSALVDDLHDQVSWLRDALKREQSERRRESELHADELQRRDVLALEQQRTISELAGQLRALQAIEAPESHQSTEDVEPDELVIEAEIAEPEPTTHPWWRFWRS